MGAAVEVVVATQDEVDARVARHLLQVGLIRKRGHAEQDNPVHLPPHGIRIARDEALDAVILQLWSHADEAHIVIGESGVTKGEVRLLEVPRGF